MDRIKQERLPTHPDCEIFKHGSYLEWPLKEKASESDLDGSRRCPRPPADSGAPSGPTRPGGAEPGGTRFEFERERPCDDN